MRLNPRRLTVNPDLGLNLGLVIRAEAHWSVLMLCHETAESRHSVLRALKIHVDGAFLVSGSVSGAGDRPAILFSRA